ncbi:peptide deformylase [Ferrovibrio sp.]|uniref:peptide deformylase n=1 Tax=Ferrovibrio sp. TaxID=1917215 RepID=UPI001B412CCA|nr:peptide deformylase [Ferrovibrio sp.]MBP7064474.1 peptide deformylase [Ferrovibrio sp.]
MAILKIARMGHPILAQSAALVPNPAAPEILRLVDDMVETMFDAPGQGLAAPQVHVGLRVAVFITPPDAEGQRELVRLINPTWEKLGEAQDMAWEGCLSVPGLRGLVPRYTHIRYSGILPDGQRLEREVSGWHARVVQHEFDHLDGMLYPQRMRDLSDLIFESEMRHRTPPQGPATRPEESET